MYSGLFKVDHLIGDSEAGQTPFPDSVRLLHSFMTNDEMADAVKTELGLSTTESKTKPGSSASNDSFLSDW